MFIPNKHFIFTKASYKIYKQKNKSFMAIKLTQAAKDKILEDKMLFLEITEMLDIKLTSLYSAINRNASKLARHDVAKKIASKMGVTVDEIFEKETELVS